MKLIKTSVMTGSILLGIASVIGALVASYFLLIVGAWDLIQGFKNDTITFGDFAFDLFLIALREVVAAVIGWVGLVAAFFLFAWGSELKR